jgi:membrane peptidoglycan carboxypeptidase
MALSSASRLLGWKSFRAPAVRSFLGIFRTSRIQRIVLVAVLTIAALALVVAELQSSCMQSIVLAAIARRLTFTVASGPSDAIRFTRTGPYDDRLGYSRIPDFVRRSTPAGYTVGAQARVSSFYLTASDAGLFPLYHEKNQAGLQLLDRDSNPFFEFRSPQRAYVQYAEIPRVVVETLMFIENRTMLDPGHANRNPAIEWRRLTHAVLDYGAHAVHPHHRVIGGSTLATQLEKMRHSSQGRTWSASEKGRQMLSASLRAYLDGRDTILAQQRIINDYLNSLPLAATPAQGEIIGLADGLATWYASDFAVANELLKTSPERLDALQRQQQARVYRQVLSLLLATRAPYRYLVLQPNALHEQTDRYLRVLCKGGVIPIDLRDLALREHIVPRMTNPSAGPDFVGNKARDLIRTTLLPLLGMENTYALDRLDLSVRTTIDATAQERVTQHLRGLTNPAEVSNLRQHRLLANSDPRSVMYSFTLYERASGINLLRVQSDNYNQPLNINEGTKLELGSTAKLRTLIRYLEIVEELHRKYAQATPPELIAAAAVRGDPLTAWAGDYLMSARDKRLSPMLQAAMLRRYSASPGEAFFTAGGLHYFSNFESSDDFRIVTVQEAFERSVNLVFIRLMRDVERYHVAQILQKSPTLLADAANPERRTYLGRFADQEGRVFLSRFYREYSGVSPDDALDRVARKIAPSPLRLSVLFRSVRPNAGVDEFAAFLRMHVPATMLPEQKIPALYEKYAIDKFNLSDRGYLAHVHPLELWLLSYLAEHPDATFSQVARASANERQETYSWLFRTRYKGAEDLRIRILLEEEAFQEIWRAWTRLGYPFERLVPSYATAIGVSGDTPGALAELMGVIVNQGMRYPHTAIQQLVFAENTPMETVLARQSRGGERVLSTEIASLVHEELLKVVEKGTARRACCGVPTGNGRVVPLGGKTGTGDNRVKTMGAGGRLLDERIANRTAVFVFLIGDRFFGTIMVFVPGESAENYEFTSSLPVQVFKDLEPTLKPLLDREDPQIPR